MSYFKVNEKIDAICFICKTLRVATIKRRNINKNKNVLVAICNECNNIIAIPHKEKKKK